jgi:DNA-binding response OmpR family regulator
MTAILILDNQVHRREHLSEELEKEGYYVKAISDREFDPEKFDCSAFDLAILNLFPDSMKTWDFYYDFQKYCPGFPVLVYLIKNIYALKSLKIAIKDILDHPSSHKVMQKGSQKVRSIFV